MKSNNLLDGIETEIKIQKGLKLLEFATQFYIHRSYLRNCPITAPIEDDPTPDSIRKRQQKSNTIAELNAFLINPTSYSPRLSFSMEGSQSQSAMRAPPTYSPETKSKYSPETPAGISRAKLSTIRNSIDAPESRQQMQELEKVIGVKETPKISKAATVTSHSPELSKKREEAKLNLSKKIAKIAETPKTKQEIKEKQYGHHEYLQSDISISISSTSSKKEEPSKQIRQEELPSYHSSTKKMSVIRQAESSLENLSGQFRKEKSNSGYNLSDFSSIKSNSYSVNSSLKAENFQSKLPQKVDRSAQADVKSQKYSFLDNTISQIKSSNDKSFISESKINETELNILKEISESFADQENLKYLLKMENFEMEEKYILQRMEKRFQACSKDISSIRSIDWKSLKMPTTEIAFKRPNYAHCLQTLQ